MHIRIIEELEPHHVILMAIIERAQMDLSSHNPKTREAAKEFIQWCQQELVYYLKVKGE